MIEIVRGGMAPDYMPYVQAWRWQRELHAQVVAAERPDLLVLLEHEAVFTAGRRTLPHERPQNGAPVIDVDRGGKITWHGPGQLVGYPIVRLPEPLAVVDHVRWMERILREVLRDLGVAAEQVEGRSGLWVLGPRRAEKVVAVGVRVAQGVTMHGFAVNCDNSMAGFEAIVPCGLADAGVTTLSAVLGRRVSPAHLLEAVAAAFVSAGAPADTIRAVSA